MKMYMKKTLRGLEPSNRTSEEEMQKLKAGTEVMVTVTQPRNLKFHQKFFAMLNLVFSNQSDYVKFDDMREDLAIMVGHTNERASKIPLPESHRVVAEALRERGDRLSLAAAQIIENAHKTRITAASISFAKMDNIAFEAFFSSTVDAIAANVIPGLDRDDLRRELMEFLQ